MSTYPGLQLLARAHAPIQTFHVSLTISPSNPTDNGDPTIAVVVTSEAGGSVIITQSGDLVDADFDATLVSTVDAAATVDPNVTFNTGTRRITFAAAGVFVFARIISSNPVAGKAYTLTLSSPIGLVIDIASGTFVTTADQTVPVPTGPITFGVNLSSGEFGTTGGPPPAKPPVLGSTYTYPDTANVDYFYSRGMRLFRVPFRWGRVQPDIFGDLSAADMAPLDALAAHIATLDGAVFLPDMHEFAGRRPTVVDSNIVLGNSPVTTAALADMWIKMATQDRGSGAWTSFGDACRIGFFNEPEGPSFTAASWAALLVDTLAQMRTGGITQTIHIPGAFWTGAYDWITDGNSAAYEATVLPNLPAGGGYIVEVHQYLDSDSSGTSDQATPGAGSTRLIDFTNWARSHLVPRNIKACCGEFGFANNDGMVTEARALMSYMAANAEVFDSWCVWGGGPWWNPSYMYVVQPSVSYTSPVEPPQIFVVLDYTLPILTEHPPTDLAISNSILSSAGVLGNKIGSLSLIDPDVGEFPRFSVVDDGGGIVRLLGYDVQYGVTPPVLGETYQATFSGMDRGGNTIQKTFSFPVLAAPNIGMTQTSPQTVNEGDNFVIRYVISGIVPGVSWRTWCSGGVLPQMVAATPPAWQWEVVHRAAFEAKGYKVTFINKTTVEIMMLNGSMPGNVDVTWQTLADHQTEGVNFQANFFMDTAKGCTLSPSKMTSFIRDTSLTPGWSVSLPNSVYDGDVVTHQFSLVNPSIGSKAIVTPSGQADDSDFTATFDAVMGAAATANGFCTWNAGTNELAITSASFTSLTVVRSTAIDGDANETYIVTLSSPTNSVIATASATTLIRPASGVATVTTFDFTSDTSSLAPHTRAGTVYYENSDASWTAIADNALCAGGRGVLFGPAITNLIKNPRGEGGVPNSLTKPAGWSMGSQSSKWTFVGQFVEGGKPYVRLSNNYTTALSPAGTILLNLFSDIPVTLGQMYNFQFGIRCTTNNSCDIAPQICGVNGAGTVVQTLQGSELAVGTEIVWIDYSGGLTTATGVYVQPRISLLNQSQLGLVTIDIFAPMLSPVPSVTDSWGLIPSDNRARHACLPPSGMMAVSSTDYMAADFDAVPAAEGTVIIDFDSASRFGGECILSIYSDADNYVEVRQELYGALGLYVAKNGSLIVELNDPIAETSGGYIVAGARHKLAVVYGLFDVRLILDGRLLASASPTEMPNVNAINICRDRNGANFANNYVRSVEIRDDLPITSDLILDTKKPGLSGSPGINLSGMEGGSKFPGTNRVDYFNYHPAETVKSAGAAYWLSKLGASHIRIPFRWSRVQTELLGPLDTAYLALIDATIDGFWAQGIKSLPDMHNYSSYKVNQAGFTQVNPSVLIGTAPVTLAAWLDVWAKLATHWLGNAAILGFDIMNEPSTALTDFPTFYQAQINSIAGVDPTRKIYIEGKSSSGALAWPASSGFLRNFTHPVDNDLLIFSAHNYMDKNRSGTYTNETTDKWAPEKGLWNALPFIQWRITHGLTGKRAHIGEFGFPGSSNWILTGSNAYKVYHENGIEVTQWLAGEAVNANDPMNMEPPGPVGGKVDRPQIVALTRNMFQS